MIKAHPGSESVRVPAPGMQDREKGTVDEPMTVTNNACLADKAYRHQLMTCTNRPRSLKKTMTGHSCGRRKHKRSSTTRGRL
jgi:hypothetical protein